MKGRLLPPLSEPRSVDSPDVIQLMYVSHATKPFSVAALATLLAQARAANGLVEVTGMLLHQDGAFLQVLEGQASAVELVFAKIERDPRHDRLVLLARLESDARNFADWSMGFADVTGNASNMIGFRRVGELSDLSGDTNAIRRVVTSFRDGRWRQAA
jgi:hypothetical protein